MTEKTKFDLIVIGTGPGGEGAAMKAAKRGKSGRRRRAVRSRRRRRDALGHRSRPRPSAGRSTTSASSTEPRSTSGSTSRPSSASPDLIGTAGRVIEQQSDLRQGFTTATRSP
jgi:hypothetical protein